MNDALRGILWGGLIAGVLDISDAFFLWKMRGVNPMRGLQGIASGLLGKDAFSGGAATAALGAVLHFVIAFGAAVVYYFMLKVMPTLALHPIPWGMVYGLVVFAVMNLVILPLSRVKMNPYPLPVLLNLLFAHTILVGLPIALAARR
jgi:uncharacterized membrane protein YagU involved in acid resistance